MKKERKTKFHRILETGAWLLILGSYGIAFYGVRVLPDRIATHFTLYGTPNGYGTPVTLFFLPIIMTICLGMMSLIMYAVKPESWNMPFQVNELKKEAVYRDMCTMIFALELEIAALTLYLTVKSYYQSGSGILPVIVIFFTIITVTIVCMCRRAYKHNQ
jgi:uncharacterized membrane protein